MMIDARGIGCPKTVLMAEEALGKTTDSDIEVLVDNEASVSNLAKFAAKNGFHAETMRENNHWRVKIVRGCEVKVSGSQPHIAEKAKALMVIIATDTLGKDEKLGRILMKAYFETMQAYKEIPDTLFLMNAAVKFTTTDEEMVPLLKGIEALGTEIYTCGTCLKYFNIESELKVGFRGTTNHIIEGTREFKKTLWIG